MELNETLINKLKLELKSENIDFKNQFLKINQILQIIKQIFLCQISETRTNYISVYNCCLNDLELNKLENFDLKNQKFNETLKINLKSNYLKILSNFDRKYCSFQLVNGIQLIVIDYLNNSVLDYCQGVPQVMSQIHEIIFNASLMNAS